MAGTYSVYMKCPNTRKLVATGQQLDKAHFEPDQNPYGTVNCPHCHQPHTWDKTNTEILLTV
jgi:hypothetical protein